MNLVKLAGRLVGSAVKLSTAVEIPDGAIGALIGGGSGAILGALAGGKQHRLRRALAGGAAGAGIGGSLASLANRIDHVGASGVDMDLALGRGIDELQFEVDRRAKLLSYLAGKVDPETGRQIDYEVNPATHGWDSGFAPFRGGSLR